MNFSRSKKIKFVKFHIIGKKIRKIWKIRKIEKLREKNVETKGKKLSDRNDPNRTMWLYVPPMKSGFHESVLVSSPNV